MAGVLQLAYKAIDGIRPGASFVIGNTMMYQDLVWNDVIQSKPTINEYASALDQAFSAAYGSKLSRLLTNRGDAQIQAMLDRLQNSTNAQIANYVQNNVTDLASAKVLLTQILLIIAMGDI